jgi:acylpyruvate hydrolase
MHRTQGPGDGSARDDPQMRWATIRTDHGTRAARVEGARVVELDHADVGALLAAGPDALGRAVGATGPEHDLAAAVDLAPVVSDPGKMICLGLNYESHIRETGREPPAFPTLFAKFTDALIGARDPIVLPSVSQCVDWEVELAFVIGRPVRHASPEEAAAAIAGFTICNDISVRDWQRRTLQWLQGKTFERSTPLGPVLVTPDELGGVAPDLLVRCEVDGVTRQEARTGDLVFGPADIVAYVSTILTLRPGDVISTGTPAGVGDGMDPPVYLAAGQTVRTSIEGIGELVNVCVQEMP